MLLHQNSGKNHYLKTVNKCFENVAKLKYMGTTITSQNRAHDEINSMLNSKNASCHAVQDHLPSRLLSADVKIKQESKSVLFGVH
jgi:hypothetical protein